MAFFLLLVSKEIEVNFHDVDISFLFFLSNDKLLKLKVINAGKVNSLVPENNCRRTPKNVYLKSKQKNKMFTVR